MNNLKSAGIIYESDDYSMFNILSSNRKVYLNGRKMEKLVKSISSFGQLLPGVINDKYEVIDGQHRLSAAKILGKPFKFIIVPGLSINQVIEVNNSQKTWTSEDFLQSYIERGNENYKTLDRFRKAYDKLSLMNIRALLGDNRLSGSFEEGGLEIHDYDIIRANKIANFIYKIANVYPNYNRRSFITAVISMYKTPKFEESTFLRHLLANRNGLYDCINIKNYLRCFESLYNKGLQQNSRIRLV